MATVRRLGVWRPPPHLVGKDAQMDAERFDHLAKALGAGGSRRWAISGLLGGVLGLSRIGAAGATHKPEHRCTPSAQHPCQTCLILGSLCDPAAPTCCQDQTSFVFCCAQVAGDDPVCDTDCLD